MARISAIIREDAEFSGAEELILRESLSPEPLPAAINGLTFGAQTHFIAETVRDLRAAGRPAALIITPGQDEAARLSGELCLLGLSAPVYRTRDFVFHNVAASHDGERERLSLLSALSGGGLDCVVTTPAAALGYTMPRGRLLAAGISVSEGDTIPPEELCSRLLSMGYARVDTVESAGQLAMRGGIVDIFPDAENEPVRIEFFGDEIDRMVYFDALTQRVTGKCPHVSILPATEVIADAGVRPELVQALDKLIGAAGGATKEKLKAEKKIAESDLPLDFRDRFFGLIYRERENLLTYSEGEDGGRGLAVFILGTSAVRDAVKSATQAAEDERKSLVSAGLVTDGAAEYSAGAAEWNAFVKRHFVCHMNPFSGGMGSMRLSGLFGFRCRRTVSYGKNYSLLTDELTQYRDMLYRTVLLTEGRAGVDSLVSSLTDDGIKCIPVYDFCAFDMDKLPAGTVAVTVGTVSEGYELLSARAALLTMAEDEGARVMAYRRARRRSAEARKSSERLMSYADLSVGDYVVHSNYGIGKFLGINTVSIDGTIKDYITIQYAGTDRLFVPCDRLEYIGKYIGARDKDGEVKLSKMGGAEWQRQKSRAKSAAKDIAKDLIRIYAERQRTPGFAFPPTSEMEEEFDAAFGYPETESQLRAIDEIRRDMCRPVPMNRLLCGDVGFGKTEVALRAAFKAVLAGKQVAVLVPTTILALQHYETALSRMRGYPVTVEMISRFRTPKAQADILKRVAEGKTDILIGTHKLLSKKIVFRDLGLLIVDEEQRFGVSQKEKLKEMSTNIDVLTLTATPIPRTLNMAMNGICDMSILEEAPGERHPVQTYVLEHDDATIEDAIRRELSRGGQVFYLYNRIEDIDVIATRLNRAIPSARIAVAHGRMDREEIEDIWQGLVRGEVDVLVSTSIIETGIDLPNANTLIIENADRFGLSQLHQLRGRVGRSSRQAYAYFTYRPGKALSEVAEKRLRAIREYAEFGAGFKIALRDMEIRGAGNLLGAEQHGYIESVGYDLYVKLLNEAVLDEQGKSAAPLPECNVDIKVTAHIPGSYISTSSGRMEMYKKISLITSEEDFSDVLDEMIDRYGEPPRETTRLCIVALIRAYGIRSGISRVEARAETLKLYTDKPSLEGFAAVSSRFPGTRLVTSEQSTYAAYRLPKSADGLNTAKAMLEIYVKYSGKSIDGGEEDNK